MVFQCVARNSMKQINIKHSKLSVALHSAPSFGSLGSNMLAKSGTVGKQLNPQSSGIFLTFENQPIQIPFFFSVILSPILVFGLSVVPLVGDHFVNQVHWRITIGFILRSPTSVSFATKSSCVTVLLFGTNFATLAENLLNVRFARLPLHSRTTSNGICTSTWVLKQCVVQSVENYVLIAVVWEGTWQPIQVDVLCIPTCSNCVPSNHSTRSHTLHFDVMS